MKSWISSGRAGRDPAKLMAPFTTFQNCGISSMFHFRIKALTLSTWGSPLAVQPTPFFSRSSRMERIFQMKNRSPSRPTLTCR